MTAHYMNISERYWILGSFQPVFSCKYVATNIHVQFLIWSVFFHFSWVYTWESIEIWGHMLIIFLAIWWKSRPVFWTGRNSFHSHQKSLCSSLLTPYQYLLLPDFLIITFLMGMLSYHTVFQLHFPSDNRFWASFYWSVYQWRKLVETFDLLLDLVICSLLSLIVRVLTLCTVDVRSLSAMRFASIFFHPLLCFHLFNTCWSIQLCIKPSTTVFLQFSLPFIFLVVIGGIVSIT